MNETSPASAPHSEAPQFDPTTAESTEAQMPPSDRWLIDQSCRQVVLLWYGSAVFWLIFGSLLAMIASIKMHTPWFLADTAWLTFGRVRPAHLNTMIYGWGSMSGIGTMLWLFARLCKTRLVWREALYMTAIYWNTLVAVGTIAILTGYSTSVEWMEFPAWAAGPIAFAFFVIHITAWKMLANRRKGHLYISLWYLFGCTMWFPFLYLAATVFIQTPASAGIAKMATNWWFAHNVLGLWLTPIGLASVYYFIPKVIGRPIHSYHFSLLGFWTLAIFYNWAGTHHLIGGPLPAWVITVGIVGSLMMFIPVTTVAINHHMTMVGYFHVLKTSPTLRFIVFGAMSYTAVSVQGSLQSIRAWNEVTHFTHYTIAHAHLGVYAFFTMVSFGSMYYVMPRLVECEWPSAPLIKVHFWGTAIGMSMYWIGLTWHGVEQGLAMNNPDIPFIDIVQRTIPYLWSRSVAGTLMTIGHCAFAISVWYMLRRHGATSTEPTLFTSPRRLFRFRQPARGAT